MSAITCQDCGAIVNTDFCDEGCYHGTQYVCGECLPEIEGDSKDRCIAALKQLCDAILGSEGCELDRQATQAFQDATSALCAFQREQQEDRANAEKTLRQYIAG